ncbi:MAG TPA: hypothetical protein PLM53_14435 [Spirochaetota bacterium]|nr:hypothetical protein [Spirochaetota bacterium]HPC41927.1 hypothetical protein [Spirochaetota bacterium]HPL17345.1 hypothetical protein [Spirochaetota bacterium]HQF09637.1 hypothetical protein [Spirochaetota bacterium]HQH98293.1 hypothetical protein [Spirochaetota bacterium]
MKRSIALCLPAVIVLTASLAGPLYPGPRVEEKEKNRIWHVIVDRVPATVEEFKTFRNSLAATPQGGIVAYLVAHLVMIDNYELGMKCLILSLDKSLLVDSTMTARRWISVEGWQLGTSETMMLNSSGFVKDKGYAAWSFVDGASTAKGYRLPQLPYRYSIRAHAYQDSDPSIWKGHANTSCHDLGYVPIHVKKNDTGIWKVVNSSSFYSGCKDPVAEEKDDL